MKRGWIFLALTVAGTVVPMTQLLPWIALHGLDLALFRNELFANPISSFFVLDVLVSALVVLYRAVSGRKRLHLWWVPALATLLVGVSAGLPLLLYLEARQQERETAGS